MVTIDSTLDAIMQLDYASREMVLEILKKRQIEARRDEIAKNAKKSLKEYRAGQTKPMTAKEVIDRLNSL
jgi:hypothetical protein